MTSARKWNYVFGPVPSRRLGLSLGVDVIPRKVCTLDCIYCEVGPTDKRALRRREYFPAEAITAEIEQALSDHANVDYISFSGSGEPTLNSKLGEILRSVSQLTSIPTAVITNGTLLSLEDVRYDLLSANVVLPSLDAVSPDVFERIDRPHPQLRIESIIDGMVHFREEYKGQIWLEIMLVKGFNDHDEEIRKLGGAIQRIRPDRIQLNTVIRPPSQKGTEPVSKARMKEIQAILGNSCEIIGTFEKNMPGNGGGSRTTEILGLLERRAMTLEGLMNSQNATKQSVLESLRALKEAGLIVSFTHQDEEHFRALEKRNGD